MNIMEIRTRPKSDYIHTASWQQLYVLTEHWLSDLEYYKDEIRFLIDLINKYFIWLVDDENINELRKLTNHLKQAEKTQIEIAETTANHLSHLVEFCKTISVNDEQKFREEHARLEDNFAAFIKDFKALKKDIFKTTRKVIEAEKLKRLLTS